MKINNYSLTRPSDVKRLAILMVVVVTAARTPVHAQSSVTLYGVISTGLGYISNQGGSSQYSVVNGPFQPPRIGFKGREELGGGTAAIFTLENGFSITSGAASQGARMFGRQAWIGLDDVRLGMLTIGRQYDELSQQLYWSEAAVNFGSQYATHIGDSDNIFDTTRFNNSIRYVSKSYSGLSLSGQFAFSNSASGFSDNSGFSFGATYSNGALRSAIAMAQMNHPASSNMAGAISDSYGYSSPFVVSRHGANTAVQRIVAAAVGYDFGFASASANYSNVLFGYLDSTRLRLDNLEVEVSKRVTPGLLIGVGYTLTSGRYSSNEKVQYNQFNSGAVYSLSKQTDIFCAAIFQKAGGAARYAQIYATSPSDSKSQMVIVSGMRHKF